MAFLNRNFSKNYISEITVETNWDLFSSNNKHRIIKKIKKDYNSACNLENFRFSIINPIKHKHVVITYLYATLLVKNANALIRDHLEMFQHTKL